MAEELRKRAQDGRNRPPQGSQPGADLALVAFSPRPEGRTTAQRVERASPHDKTTAADFDTQAFAENGADAHAQSDRELQRGRQQRSKGENNRQMMESAADFHHERFTQTPRHTSTQTEINSAATSRTPSSAPPHISPAARIPGAADFVSATPKVCICARMHACVETDTHALTTWSWHTFQLGRTWKTRLA
jgi:hypothetical protein